MSLRDVSGEGMNNSPLGFGGAGAVAVASSGPSQAAQIEAMTTGALSKPLGRIITILLPPPQFSDGVCFRRG